MRSSKRPVSRLGLAMIAALLSLATATTMAAADPTSPPSEPPPSSESSPPSEPSTPPSSEPSTPPSSEPSTPPESDETSTKSTTKDVTVAAEFGKPSYDTGEDMTISLALKNTGAEDMRVIVDFPARWNVPNAIHVTATTTFKEYEEFGIAAGETVTNVLTGSVVDPDATSGKLSVWVAGPGGPVEHTFTVPVNKKLATATGRVFHDRNGNGQQDRGEGVAARLEWEHKVNNDYEPSVTAGTDGAFSIELVPGTYNVRGSSGSFLVTPQVVTVPASGVDGLVFEARPSLSELEVTMAFTKDTFKPNEAPSVRVTLTNNNFLEVTEVIADCFHGTGGSWPILTGTGAGWGDLAAGGVTVPGKSTKVLTVTEPMPATAENYGFVTVDCVFAYAELTGDLYNPRASAEAAVPGKTGDLTGYVTAEEAGWRVVMTGKDGKCPIVAETKTDDEGGFTLNDVPAGQYEVYVMPTTTNWMFKGNNHKPVLVVAGQDNDVTFVTLPNNQPNNTYTPPPSCGDGGGGGGPGTNPPGPQGSPAPGLAYTGASMLVPGAVGLLALLAGIGAVLVTRRRRAS